jgi:hypothetical protein
LLLLIAHLGDLSPFYRLRLSESTKFTLSPIQRMTGTAMLLPSAL